MINVIELFAGVGGFRVGLEESENFKVVWGNQWEPSKKAQDAFNCYAHRFKDNGEHINKDIATINTNNIPNAELLVGGFPCQDYSVARSLSGEKGIQGKKGVLFWEIVRILKDKQPKYVLLENVDRLLKSPSTQRGRDFSIMLASFRDLGYFVEWRVINAAEYGHAQRRRRIFIFAYKKETNFARNQIDIDSKDLLHEGGFFVEAFPVQHDYESKHKPTEYELPNDILEVSDSFSAQYRNAGIMRDGMIYSEEIAPVPVHQMKLSDILQSNVNEKYYLGEEAIKKFEYLKGPKKIERTAASGHKYIFSEGGMSFPENMDMPGRTMLTSEGTVNRSSHVVADPATGKIRILTPIECERLNEFPDDWTNTGMSERMRYFCMGNALVVGLIKKMGKRISEIHQNEMNNEIIYERKIAVNE